MASTGLFHKSDLSWAIEEMLKIMWCLVALVGANESTMSGS